LTVKVYAKIGDCSGWGVRIHEVKVVFIEEGADDTCILYPIQWDSIGEDGSVVCPSCKETFKLTSGLTGQGYCECPHCSDGIEIM